MPIKHPDYPDIDFKPAIARYDWDQTYDVLEFVYLPQGFSSLMDLCGIPAFERMAIDRFTPYNYRWADQYSQAVYDFLKRFNFSPHNAINERLLRDEAGNLIKDENDNTITVPAFELENTQVYDYDPILANFSEGKYQITGLIYQGYQEGLSGSIPTINQAFTEFTLSESTEIDINNIIWNRWLRDDYYPNENFNRFCSNSLVISKLVNGNWIDYIPSFTSKPEYLLYSDITAYFNKIKQQLVDYFQTIHDDFIKYFTDKDYIYIDIFPLQYGLNKIDYQINIILEATLNVYSFSTWTAKHDPIKINVTTIKFPSYLLDYCYLAIANNNKWSTGINYGDLGEIKINLAFLTNNTREPAQIYSIYTNDGYRYPWVSWAGVWAGAYISKMINLLGWFYAKKISINNVTIGMSVGKVIPAGIVEGYYQIKIDEVKVEYDMESELQVISETVNIILEKEIDAKTADGEYQWENNDNLYQNLEFFTQQEWEELYNENAMTDQEYLDYLLQLKEQKEGQ